MSKELVWIEDDWSKNFMKSKLLKKIITILGGYNKCFSRIKNKCIYLTCLLITSIELN